MNRSFTCDRCGKTKTSKSDSLGVISVPGYGTDPKTNEKICYDCCASDDRATMLQDGKHVLYLEERPDGSATVRNWPGTLAFRVFASRKSHHNFAGRNARTDFWFNGPDGHVWHGYQIGHWNQIAHVRRTKELTPCCP